MSKRMVPGFLKRLLAPIWNEAHRIGWIVVDHAYAIVHGNIERCSVCGRIRPMLYRRRVIPRRLAELWRLSPGVARALARKESSDCSGCGAKLRARRLADVLLDLYPTEDDSRSPSITAWVNDPGVRRLKVAEINRVDGLHEQLSHLPELAYSDFQPGQIPGALVDGVRSEDLTRLTYPDCCFDLVITSESLEHVPDLRKALGEIFRVLRHGGRHIFTIPRIPGVSKTFARSVLHEDGRLEHLATPISHPGGDVGYPVFTEFGADFPGIVREAGFDVETLFGPITENDLCEVYHTRKP